jgi:hypothetical protein
LPGRIALNMFPSKFSFDIAAPPSCANDYVVFGLSVAGTATKANLVAFNNLYAGPGGPCGAAPAVLFAYNITTVPTVPGVITGGKISTSPALSLDGTKIAFVESVVGPPAVAIFHVLTWNRGDGALNLPATPNMTSLTFAAANSTTSAPWIDFVNDVAYLGADDAKIYKIIGVFRGTPALAGAPWPVTVSPNFRLTPPVLDSRRHMLMVGSANGKLYQIDTVSGQLKSLVVGLQGTKNPGILGTPIVDVTNGTTFVVSANDGTSGVLVEADTASLTQLAKARIGVASANAAKTVVDLFQPAFSDSYFTNPSTGLVRLCGTGDADTTPFQYAFGFTGTTMLTTPSFKQQLLTSPDARCTGWTEFFNPNINGGTDFFFFGLTQDCTGNGLPAGCVVSRSSDTVLTKATLNGGPSGIVVDNFSTVGQASSIYVMADRLSKAFKFTQNGLQ